LASKRNRCHRIAEGAGISPISDHAAKLAKGDRKGAILNRDFPGALAHIIVVALKPSARDAKSLSHRVKFMVSVSDHVEHDHSAMAGRHVVDVNGHDRAATPVPEPAAILG